MTDVTFRDAGIRSPILRLVNTTGRFAAMLGKDFPALSAKGLMAQAEKETGLADFGNLEFLPGLERLVDSLVHDAHLTTFGRIVQKKMLTQFLAVRLAVTDWIEHNPDVLKEKITSPWVIAGLPRTGTTLLSHLLELDPHGRSLLGWEALDPVPPTRANDPQAQPRIQSAIASDAQLNQLIPPLRAMHPMEPTLPTECVTLFACDFRSLLFATQTPVSSYAQWLRETALDSAYHFHHQVLRMLQSVRTPQRWSLKTPQHLWSLPALFRTYPDARVIWTHRDPHKVIPSVASLNMAFYRTFTHDPDPKEAGLAWQQELAAGVQNPGWCVHLLYEELMENPVAAVAKIYSHFGDELSEEHAAAIRQWSAHRPQSIFGRHRYEPSAFGLNAESIAEDFGPYMSRFQIPREERD